MARMMVIPYEAILLYLYDGCMTGGTHPLRLYGLPLGVLLGGVAIGFLYGGLDAAFVVIILAVLEIGLSFDNAVVNASVLRRLNEFWQRMFLTVGMVIAVVGVRLLLPIVIVMLTASLGFGAVFDLALNHPELYALKLTVAHPAIAAFGGMFLLLIFLDFVIDETKQVHWIETLERPLAKAGRVRFLSTVIALAALWLVSATLAGQHAQAVVTAGLVGLMTYLVVRLMINWFERHSQAKPGVPAAGRAGFLLFVYLQVLDAAFSFDSVIGAFAITTNVITIAVGLGIGAFFVRELTVWLVRHRALEQFIYLEHGAQYSVGALAVLLALSLAYDIPDVVTGLIGALFISLAFVSSLRAPHKARRV
jgi:uncharacterized protein